MVCSIQFSSYFYFGILSPHLCPFFQGVAEVDAVRILVLAKHPPSNLSGCQPLAVLLVFDLVSSLSPSLSRLVWVLGSLPVSWWSCVSIFYLFKRRTLQKQAAKGVPKKRKQHTHSMFILKTQMRKNERSQHTRYYTQNLEIAHALHDPRRRK